MEIRTVSGGVCAAKGFTASGIHCGIRKNKEKRDLSLIKSDVPATAAAVYTQNLVKGAPLTVTKDHIKNGTAQAIICNSGNANTCNADGIEVAERMCELAGDALGIAADEVIVASTGVIGKPMDVTPIADGIPALVAALSDGGSGDAAEGIMTTDTKKKEVAVEFTLGGKTCRIGGIAKGSGMIHPNLATMLVFITCDAAVSAEMLQKALSTDIKSTFNMVSIDGDTSTNDMVVVMCNGLAGNAPITCDGEDFDAFARALNSVTVALCRMIAGDGEGCTRMIECAITGARDEKNAKIAAKAVVCSSLVKSMIFGADANFGRVFCAVGYSGADVDVAKMGVSFKSAAGEIEVAKDGHSLDFDEDKAKSVLTECEITIAVTLGDGDAEATAYGCDLTYDYVKINADYRT